MKLLFRILLKTSILSLLCSLSFANIDEGQYTEYGNKLHKLHKQQWQLLF